jgi:hypothetical protein
VHRSTISGLKNMLSRYTRAAQCRRNAYYCQMLAPDAASDADRSCLMRMRRAWLALAANEEWLDGEWTSLTITGRDVSWPAEREHRKNPT